VVNLGSNSVANTLPAGGALAMGVSWAMLSSWGVGTAEYVLYTLVSGVWNVLARLGLPVLALLVLMTAARPGALLIAAAAVGLGLSQAQVPWQTSLAAFAFVRLLTALPLTPGGLGLTELGLVGILAAGAGHRVSAQVTAAVLLYRAVTYLPPIPLGALACLAW